MLESAKREKKRKNPLSGAVCLLTRRGLIGVLAPIFFLGLLKQHGLKRGRLRGASSSCFTVKPLKCTGVELWDDLETNEMAL